MTKTGIKELDEYCEGVKSGDIDVCKWVRLAVDRHYRDLKESKKKSYPYYFEPKAAEHYFEYIGNLKHYEGAVSGEYIKLEPWQKFVFGSIFGWLKKERFKDIPIRRFRTALIYVPKKNGKSIISGGTGLYMMDADGWPGAQCYILAKNQKHAMDLGYRAAVNMVQNSDVLAEIYKINYGAMNMGVHYRDNNNAFYKPITSKPDSEDGRNVHFCGPDETKDWTDREIYGVMKNGTVNAPNSLFMCTTTAGYNQDSLGFEQEGYLKKVLEGTVEDDSTFGVIYTIDEDDKLDENGDIREGWWYDPKVWEKANPNFNVSVFEDSLAEIGQHGKESINARIDFETKHLNVWHSANQAFITAEKWNKCGTRKLDPVMLDYKKVLDNYRGEPAWAGLDLGSVSDFTAFVIVIGGDIIPLFWIPKDTIADRKNSTLVNGWVASGHIGTTEGDWTDHDYIEQCIKEVAEIVDLQEVVYDRYKMDQMVTHLMDEGIEMTPFGQGYVSMAPAVDYLENCILKQEIEHFNNPVLAWMNSNISIRKDPAGNRKFDKEKASDKIDGMVALGMALFRSSVPEEDYPVFEGGLTVI